MLARGCYKQVSGIPSCPVFPPVTLYQTIGRFNVDFFDSCQNESAKSYLEALVY